MSNSQLSAIRIRNSYGVSKNSIRFLSQAAWSIPSDYLEFFSDYHLLYWKGDYFQSQLRDGTIKGHTVVYHNCTPTKVFKAEQVALSFRTPDSVLGLGAVVLVSVKRGSN